MKRIIHRILSKLRKLRNYPQKRLLNSDWYYSKFPHLRNYRRLTQGLDVIVVGSTPAKFSVDFSQIDNVKGANLAVQPETITYDFRVLKNYHSYLKEGGTILFVLCPFTFCKDTYREEEGSFLSHNIRYYPILHRAMIDDFDINIYEKWVLHPFRVGKEAYIGFVKDLIKGPLLKIRKFLGKGNPTPKIITEEGFEHSAQKRIDAWKNEFCLSKLDSTNLPPNLSKAISTNVEVFKQMIVFLKERGYKYKIIIPPFSKELTAKIPVSWSDTTLFNPLDEIGADFISYFRDSNWMKNEHFSDAFIMNENGRSLLTKDIVNKIFD